MPLWRVCRCKPGSARTLAASIGQRDLHGIEASLGRSAAGPQTKVAWAADKPLGHWSSSVMHPLLRPSLAGPIAIVSVAIWSAFALLVVAIGPGPKVLPIATAVPAIDQNVRVISLTVAGALRVSTAKRDRLPLSPDPPAEPAPAIKPAEAIDYAQA